jgi:hypothetical protein
MALRARLAFLALFLAKLALVLALPRTAQGGAEYDDALFVRLGASIAAGRWLGDYDVRTLAKGAGYPLFLAAGERLGLPLQASEQLLYGLFALLAVLALAPLFPRAGARLALFALLLFQPAGFPTEDLARLTRDTIYPAQTGLCLALAAGLALRINGPPRRALPWSLGLGLALGWLWITREEGAWITPPLACLLGGPLLAGAWRRAPGWIGRAALCIAPAVVAAAVVASLAALNALCYGRFLTVETKEPAFLAAYGALARVRPAAGTPPRVPVARATRARVYPLSPAFAELEPWLEGPIGERWELAYPRTVGEIEGGWFLWALREAVQAAGHARSPAEASAFYARLAAEVHGACDEGRLAAWPRRDGLLPRGQPRLAARMGRAAWPAWRRLLSFAMVAPELRASSGTPAELAAFADLANSALAPTAAPLTAERSLPLRLVGWIGAPYRWLGAAWTWASLAAFAVLSLAAAARLRAPRAWILPAALLLAVAVRLALLAWIHVTSFPALVATYASSLYPPLLLFDALVTRVAVGARAYFGSRSSAQTLR